MDGRGDSLVLDPVTVSSFLKNLFLSPTHILWRCVARVSQAALLVPRLARRARL